MRSLRKILLGALFLSPILFTSLADCDEKKESEINQPAKETIGFKGLYLGMTGQEVLKLAETSKDWYFLSSTKKEM